MESGKTVLIVDDSRVARMKVRKLVAAAHPDWSIIEAGDGTEALEKTESNAVDLMTIDLNMPGMDGLTLATRLREKCPAAHMALLTANIQDSVRHRAEALGIDFITKPLTEDSILACISRMEKRHG